MRWTNMPRLDPHAIIYKHGLIDRTLNRNRAKMQAAGSPCTYYRNMAINPIGKTREDLTKCYCWNDQEAQPDRKHALCMGTGYIEGYQKYGYTENVITTTTKNLTKDSSIVTGSGNRENDRLYISGTTTSANIETEFITLNRFIEVDRIYMRYMSNPEANRIIFYYTNNDIDWVEIPQQPYISDLSSHTSSTGFSFPMTSTGQIKFRIVFEKRYPSSESAMFNSIRFRYRRMPIFGELNSRFNFIDIPAFLAAREQPREIVEQGEFGWSTKTPIEWWALPESGIEESDIIKFLYGERENQIHQIQELIKYQYGQSLQILHRGFNTRFIRDEDDLFGIVHLLD